MWTVWTTWTSAALLHLGSSPWPLTQVLEVDQPKGSNGIHRPQLSMLPVSVKPLMEETVISATLSIASLSAGVLVNKK